MPSDLRSHLLNGIEHVIKHLKDVYPFGPGATKRWLIPATLLRRPWIVSCISPPSVAL